ncbi:MAG: hypothetical protein JW910_07265, partial [Anaerolineae bacterium]|nr:hypothetical protein [Anaerolineae bacterium]
MQSLFAVVVALMLLVAGWPAQAQGDPAATPTAVPPTAIPPTATPPPTPIFAPAASLPQFGQMVQECGNGVRTRGPEFAATGVILTTFSRDALWVVELARNARYPLPEMRPCGPNCTPSPDRTHLLYVSAETATFWQMSIDGITREQVYPYYVSAMEWWDTDTWLV